MMSRLMETGKTTTRQRELLANMLYMLVQCQKVASLSLLAAW